MGQMDQFVNSTMRLTMLEHSKNGNITELELLYNRGYKFTVILLLVIGIYPP